MIFVTGFGQMCNNMLQFGHFFASAKRNGLKTVGLRFCYKYTYFKISDEKGYNWPTYLFAKYAAKLGLIKTVDFDETFDGKDFDLLQLGRKNILAKGWYFRDYSGFLHYRSDLKAIFDFKDYIKKPVNQFFSRLSKDSIKIGLHIRRGDYRIWHQGQYFFNDEEYAKIINSFIKNIDKPAELIIVSNDPKLNSKDFEKLTSCKVSMLNGNPAEDLYLLSKCDYIIGPPSTFSLMAAFYEDSPLYWIFDKEKPLLTESFDRFENLFRHII